MDLEHLTEAAPHVMRQIMNNLDASSTRRLLWVSSKLRSFTRDYLHSSEGMEKEKHFAIDASLAPAVVAIPYSIETHHDEDVMDGSVWDHSKSSALNDSPPTQEQVLQLVSGEKKVGDYEGEMYNLQNGGSFCQSKLLKEAKWGLGYFGCRIAEAEQTCEIYAFKTNQERDSIKWEVKLDHDAPLYGTKEVSFCVPRSGSLVVSMAYSGKARLVRLAEGNLLAEKTLPVDRHATITLGSYKGKIVLAEDSADYSILQLFKERDLQHVGHVVLRTGQSDTDFSASIEIVAGFAVQVVQGRRSLNLLAYKTKDAKNANSIFASDSHHLASMQYICGVKDAPGSFLVEKKNLQEDSTRLYYVGYPRTINLLWMLQSCKRGKEITAKLPEKFDI